METVEYCHLDVKLLYNIIKEFNLKIFRETRINAIKHPTLSSLSFAIYRSNFLKDWFERPKISGKIYNFIKEGYFGGAVDVYIPKSNTEVYRYDVDSLYTLPFSRVAPCLSCISTSKGKAVLKQALPLRSLALPASVGRQC